MLRYAYSTINWGESQEAVAMFAEIRDAGWKAVELFGHSLEWLGPPQRLLAAMNGLRPATVFASISVPAPDRQLDDLRRKVDYAAGIGAECLGLVGGNRARWRPPSDSDYDALADACESLAEHGEGAGVAVCYHPHTGCTIETEPETRRLLNRTEKAKLCLDVSHMALVGEDPLEQLARYYDRIGFVHLKDWGRGNFVELGKGTLGIDFRAALRILEERGFGGWVVAEQSRCDVSPVASARANREYLESIGAFA